MRNRWLAVRLEFLGTPTTAAAFLAVAGNTAPCQGRSLTNLRSIGDPR